MRRTHAAIGLALTAGAACSIDWDVLDPSLAGSTASSSSGGGSSSSGGAASSGGSPSTGGAGGVGGQSVGGNGGMGGAGGRACPGPSQPLVSRGLLTRYYLDEAMSGTTPTALVDHAPDPLPLALTYVGGNAFTSDNCNEGMHWPMISTDGRAEALVLGTKIETALDGECGSSGAPEVAAT